MTYQPQFAQEKAGGRVVVLLVLGLVVLFGGAYAAAYAVAGEKVPRGATVAGVEIGGRTHAKAVEALREGLAERSRIAVTIDGQAVELDAADVGLVADLEASVEAAGGGRSWKPNRLWDYYTGGDDLDPVLEVDETALNAALDTLDKRFGTPPKEGDVKFVRGEVRRVVGSSGKAFDRVGALDALVSAYFSGDTADLSLVTVQPEIDENDVQDAMNEFANAAVSGPVTLVFDKTRVKLTPQQFGTALGMKPQNGVLVPELDEKRLAKAIYSQFSSSNGAPRDATVRLVDGVPTVIPSRPGIGYDPKEVNSTFLDLVVAEPGHRKMAVKATVKRADFSTKEARALKIRERVSSFTTYFPHANYRNTNIGRAAELVNGTVLKPGETFSLNYVVGERTKRNGFTEGFIIDDGIFKQDLGGGVSQMATTTFNAMFFAGLEDVEHKPHSFYIDRYPVGREATVAWGSVDLKFRNDTPYGVLIQASVTPSTQSSSGVVTVSMWSTKYWDITTKTGERYNFTEPKTRTITDPECEPNDGYGGFDINVYRYFRKHGSSKLDHTEKFHTTYTPSDTVICNAPPPDDRAG